jgi:hypothetical protein
MSARRGEALAEDPVIAGAIARHRDEASALIAAHGHARTRTTRFARWLRPARKAAPAPVSQLLEAPADISDTGTFTGIVRAHESEAEPLGEEAFARPATAAPREDEAAARVVAERADLARIYAPENREPMAPSTPYRWDHRADFRDLPLFKSTVRAACKAGLRGIGTRGVHPVAALPDYGLDRFTVPAEPKGDDPGFELGLIEAYAENGFYEARRVFHSADTAGFKPVEA